MLLDSIYPATRIGMVQLSMLETKLTVCVEEKLVEDAGVKS